MVVSRAKIFRYQEYTKEYTKDVGPMMIQCRVSVVDYASIVESEIQTFRILGPFCIELMLFQCCLAIGDAGPTLF